MKKTFILCVAFGAILFSACGNKTSKGEVTSDSTVVTDTVATTDSLQKVENQKDETALEEVTSEKANEQQAEAKKNAKSIQLGGVTVTVGAPLAETLRKMKSVNYSYSADNGVYAEIDGYGIPISDEDMTKAGTDFINALLSDIEPNIAFKPEFIKPSAKIKGFEKF